MFFFGPNAILIASAVIPAIALLIYVYKADRLEKESTPLLVSLVLYGIVATFGAIVTERLGNAILSPMLDPSSVAYRALLYFVVVGCSEEGFKYLLLKRKTWNNPEFNCQFDGVVYAVFVSLGFALWENISYVLMYGLRTALVRSVTAVPGHACFGVFMGTWYGMAKRYQGYGLEEKSKLCRTLAFVMPVLLHGAYDYIASSDEMGFAWVFFGFIALLFFSAWRTVKKVSRTDSYIDPPSRWGI